MSLINESEPAIQEVIRDWTAKVPAFIDLFEAARLLTVPVRLLPGAGGLELAAENSLGGLPNRGRLRVVPYEGGDFAVFFFRASINPAVKDRFGYGGAAFRADRVRPDQVRSWLEYLVSGFAATTTPRGLKRSFQFPVPD